MGAVLSMLISVVILAFAAGPGYPHRRTFRRILLQDMRSPLVKVVGLFAAGGLATSVFLHTVRAPAEWVPTFVSVDNPFRQVELAQHPQRVLLSSSETISSGVHGRPTT